METCRTYLTYDPTGALPGPRIRPEPWAGPSSEQLRLSLDGDSCRWWRLDSPD